MMPDPLYVAVVLALVAATPLFILLSGLTIIKANQERHAAEEALQWSRQWLAYNQSRGWRRHA